MFSAEEHLYGWLIYMAFLIGVFVVFWRLTRRIPWLYTKQAVRLIGSAVLLVPIPVQQGSVFWAPAWVVSILEFIFNGLEGFLPIGRVIIIGVLIALMVYCVLLMVFQIYRQKIQKQG